MQASTPFQEHYLRWSMRGLKDQPLWRAPDMRPGEERWVYCRLDATTAPGGMIEIKR